MKRDLPTKPVKPPISPEELAEITRRLDPAIMDEQRRNARPADEVLRELRQKYAGPR
jgi:hypothetical protein